MTANVFEFAEKNAPRTCSDNDCQRDADFYVHGEGAACAEHAPVERGAGE